MVRPQRADEWCESVSQHPETLLRAAGLKSVCLSRPCRGIRKLIPPVRGKTSVLNPRDYGGSYEDCRREAAVKLGGNTRITSSRRGRGFCFVLNLLLGWERKTLKGFIK